MYASTSWRIILTERPNLTRVSFCVPPLKWCTVSGDKPNILAASLTVINVSLVACSNICLCGLLMAFKLISVEGSTGRAPIIFCYRSRSVVQLPFQCVCHELKKVKSKSRHAKTQLLSEIQKTSGLDP